MAAGQGFNLSHYPFIPIDVYLPRVNIEKGEKGREEERTPKPKQVPNSLNPMDRLELKVTPRPLPSPSIWDPLTQQSPLSPPPPLPTGAIHVTLLL